MLQQGHGLVPFSSNGSEAETNLHPTSSSVELSKMRQMYKAKKMDDSKVYEVFYPIKKKPVFGASKVAGMLALSTPKKEYVMEYVSPLGTQTAPLPLCIYRLTLYTSTTSDQVLQNFAPFRWS